MSNAIDDFISREAERQLKDNLAVIKEIHQEILAVNKTGLNFNGNKNVGGSSANTASKTSELTALEKERTRVANALTVATARLTIAGEENTQELARRRQSLRVLGSAYLELSAKQNESSRRVQDLIARGKTATQTQREYNRELKTAQSEFDKLNKRVLQADTAVGRFNRNVGNYPMQAVGGIKNLLGAFGIVGGVTAIAMVSKNIFETTKQLQGMDLALKQVMGSSDAAAKSQAFLADISERYGIELVGLTKSYTGFYAASKNALDSGAISAQQINDIFESVSKASGAMGLSVEQQEGAFLALQQMISKGTVQAEEIRGQLAERLPGAFGILAKSMNVTEIQLNKMLKDGKVLAAEVLPAFAKELEKAYGVENIRRVETLNAETSRLSNTWTEFIRELNSGDGVVTKFFGSIVSGLNGALNGFRLLIQSRDSLLQDRNTAGSTKGYDELISDLEVIGNLEARRSLALQLQNSEQASLFRKMQELNKLTQQQKDLESKGQGSDPLSDLLGEESQYVKNEKAIENLNFQIGIREGRLKAISKILEEVNPKEKATLELTKEQIAENKRLADMLAKLREEYAKNDYALRLMRRESEKDSLQELMEDEKEYLGQRLILESDLTEQELAIHTDKLNEELRLAKKNYDERVIEAKGNAKILEQVNKNYLLDQQTAYEAYNEKILKTTKTSEERILKLKEDYLDKYYEYRAKFDGEGLKIDLAGLGLTKEGFKAFQEELTPIEKKMKDLKEATDEWIKSFSSGFFSDAGFPTLFKFLNEELTGFGEDFKTTFLGITEIAQEAVNFLNQNSQAYFDNQYARLKREYDLNVLYAGDSASAKAEIDKQYEDRKREVRIKEAKATRELAIFNAVVNTAQAVVAALPNIALSVLAGVIGAAQIALIASQPLPEFWKGTMNAPEGWAVVDEKRPEVHTDSKGNIKSTGSTKGANRRYLEKGDKIYKSHDFYLDKLLSENGISMHSEMAKSQLSNVVFNGDNSDIASEIKALRSDIRNSKSDGGYKGASITKTGAKEFFEELFDNSQSFNDRVNFKIKKY